MQQLTNVQLLDNYDPSTTLGPGDVAKLLTFWIWNSAATVQLYKNPAGAVWQRGPVAIPEQTLQPGFYSFPDCIGIQAKKANPRTNPRMTAQLYFPADIVPSAFTPTGVIAGVDPATGLPQFVNQPITVFGPVLSQQTNHALTVPQVLGPFDMRGYKSVAMQLKETSGLADVRVDLVWEMSDDPGVAQTTNSATLARGTNQFLLLRNQGDTLVSVTFTSVPGAGAILSSEIEGCNDDPLAKGAGDCPIRYNILNGTQVAFEDAPAAGQCHGWVYIETDTVNPASGNDFDIVVETSMNIQSRPGAMANFDLGFSGLVDIEAEGTFLAGSTGGDASFFGQTAVSLGAQGDTNVGGIGHAVNISDNTGKVGFFSAAAQSQKTVTGSRGGNAALASLLTALASYGLIVDGTTP